MLDLLRTITDQFNGKSATPEPTGQDPMRLAAGALLLEMGSVDGSLDGPEKALAEGLVQRLFDLSEPEAKELMVEAGEAQAASADFFKFTEPLKRDMAFEDRIQIVEALWEVALSDGVVHDYEASLVRRVCGLLHVPDKESGAARKRAEARRR